MNRKDWRDDQYRNVPPPNSYGSRRSNAPPSSQSGRWPTTTSARMRPQETSPLEEQPSSTPIPWSDAYMSKLRALVPSASVLQKQGYITQPLNEDELLLKRRCTGCGKTMSQIARWKPEIIKPDVKSRETNPYPSTSRAHPKPDPVVTPPLHCKFHVGQVVNRMWTCCEQRASPGTLPCGGAPTHIPQSYPPNELVKLYQFHSTPDPKVSPLHSLSGSPKISSAVALDCEMGTAVSGDSELIRITVIDYFTSDILINAFVQPDVPMSHLNTQYSGVTWANIRDAKIDGTCLFGTAAVRKALWRFVGPHTVIVGHGASSDLRALKWVHNEVVDSQIVESVRMKRKQEAEEEAKRLLKKETGEDSDGLTNDGKKTFEPPFPGGQFEPKKKKPKGTGDLALKTLAKKHLGRDIQMKGKLGHDSLEDAIAARDVVHWQVSNPQ